MLGIKGYGTRGIKVLVVDDEKTILISLYDTLVEANIPVVTASSAEEALNLIQEEYFDIVVSDIRLPGMNGLDLFRKSTQIRPDIYFIMMTAYGTVDQAVEAIKLGAYDYVTKPFPNEKILRMVQNICQSIEVKRELEKIQSDLHSNKISFLIGQSASWREVLKVLENVAPTDAAVLITGESGTGKELVANAIHVLSERKQERFIKVHCAALPESLIESELFGHEKGSFTGALAQMKGRFEMADGGSLLLDEVDEIPMNIQVKLLRVLQEKKIERVGSTKEIEVDVRLIATCKKDLKELVQQGRFRKDLYYRISVVNLSLPTLAQRKSDIPVLVEHFLSIYKKRMLKTVPGFTREALDALFHYDYPGNVRELEHIIEAACAMAAGNEPIGYQCLPLDLQKRELGPFRGSEYYPLESLKEAVKRFEKGFLEQSLAEFGGNRSQLASLLGISRKNLWEKLKEYGLE